MLIKACSLKLIRRWPGSFIKIDILPQHTQMSPSRTQDAGRSGQMEPSTSQVAQLSSIEPLELRRGTEHAYLSFKGTLPSITSPCQS